MRIYLAGPLFTPYERELSRRVRRAAARRRVRGVRPARAGARARQDPGGRDLHEDWDGLYNADAVLAVLDGPQTDDGTACEIGIFYALMLWNTNKKGIVGLLTDLRGTRSEEGHGRTCSCRAASRPAARSSTTSTRR